jgi:hypothetical protein
MSISSLKVEALAIHLIQRSTKANPTEPMLSEALTPLNAQNSGFLQDRLRATLKKARPVVEDPDTSSSVPGILRGLLLDGEDLLEASRGLAVALQATQAGISPPGLLLVARASLGEDSVIVIAKWEHERGARTQPTTNADGKLVYDMQFLEDLFMTEGSRVYKVAMFPASTVSSERIEGAVIDPQSSGASVAHYFRVNFLGCDYTLRPEVLTEQFHDAVQSFIDAVASPETRARYQVSLMSEMLSQKPELSATQFANDYLDPDDRDGFRAHLQQRAVPLQSSLPKDLSLVRARLKRMQIDFKHGAVVLAPPEELGDGGHVTVEEVDGLARVSILDEVTNIAGKGAIRIDSDNDDDSGDGAKADDEPA